MSFAAASCFISHTWHEGQHHFAMRLADALKREGIQVWIDEEKIYPGMHIKDLVQRGIEHESDVFLFVLSPEALKSQMCMHELNLAINQMTERGKPIIPVFFRECDIPDSLREICYADFTNDLYFEAALERLVKGIKRSAKLTQTYRKLSHPNPDERIEAAEQLGDLRNPIALGPLKTRLVSEEFHAKVKHFLAMVIGEIGGGKAVEILVQAMGEEELYPRQGIVWGTAEALGKLGEDEFNKALGLFENILNSKDRVKRHCVLEVLVNLKRKSSRVEYILRSVISDPDKNVQKMVTEYFRKKGESHGTA